MDAVLVGREPILADLTNSLSATSHRGDAILIVGEAGIGKTSCLLAVQATARAAAHLVLETSGSEAERYLRFAGLQRLLRPLIHSAEALPDVQRDALLAALGTQDGDQNNLFLVSVACLNLLRQASEVQPLLIAVDDVHWIDKETLQVLGFVARRLDRHPIVVMATLTSAQDLPDLREALRHVVLERLDDPAALQLLAHCAPGLGRLHRDWVMAHAIGNPLALIELARAGPPTSTAQTDGLVPAVPMTPLLERAFAGRLHELPRFARDAALVAAVADEGDLQEILAATTHLSGRDATDTVLEAPRSLGLLCFDETRVWFANPLVRMAITQQEPLSRRQAAHRSLGAVITVNSYRRAWHRALGTGAHDDAIAAELEATTSDSIRQGDAASAIRSLERAAHLSTRPAERGRRLLLAASHAAHLGRPDQVVGLLSAIGTELRPFDRIRAELLGEDFGGVVIADSDRVIHMCAVARSALEAGEQRLALQLAEAAARRRCMAPVSARARSEVVSLTRRLLQESGDASALAAFALADPVGHCQEVLSRLADVDQDSPQDGEALSAYAVAARAVGDLTCASLLLDRAEGDFRSRGLLGPLARNLCVAADLHLDLGEWDRASVALAEFATLSAASMSANHRAAAKVASSRLLALRGDTVSALDIVAEVEHSPEARGGSRYLAGAQIARGIAYLSSGRHSDAFAALSRVFARSEPSFPFREQYGAVAYLAEAAVLAGTQDQAGDVVERMRGLSDISGSPALIAQLLYAEAVLAPDHSAEQFFLDGLAADSSSSPWQRARIQLAYGRWLRRQQRVTQSRVPLRAALTTLQQLGAGCWARQALDELQASGAQIEVLAPLAASGQLSAQELKIAHLAAQGLTNPEIGQQLHISARTVSSHLYRVFPKLGITTRGQIAARLDAEGRLDRIG